METVLMVGCDGVGAEKAGIACLKGKTVVI